MMTSKQELTRITEWAEKQRKNYTNLEKEFAELNAKHPYETERMWQGGSR